MTDGKDKQGLLAQLTATGGERSFSEPPPDPHADRLIDERYRIVRQLQRGGMGVVCEAVDETTEQRVALKLLQRLPDLDGDLFDEETDASTVMEEYQARFQREARTIGAIDVPHVVRILDAGTDAASNEPFIVMELLQGHTLQELLAREQKLPPEIAVRVALQACRGLHAAHLAGVVHRDVKPANLYLARGDDDSIIVKILDFGIAKPAEDDDDDDPRAALTRAGSVLGSPHYMSPEQLQSAGTIDVRTDVWSMGVVLFQMLVGHTPLAHSGSMAQLLLALCVEEPAPAIDQAPWVDEELSAALAGALRLNPDERYADMQQLHDALRPFAGELLELSADDVLLDSVETDSPVGEVEIFASNLTAFGLDDAPEQHGRLATEGTQDANLDEEDDERLSIEDEDEDDEDDEEANVTTLFSRPIPPPPAGLLRFDEPVPLEPIADALDEGDGDDEATPALDAQAADDEGDGDEAPSREDEPGMAAPEWRPPRPPSAPAMAPRAKTSPRPPLPPLVGLALLTVALLALAVGAAAAWFALRPETHRRPMPSGAASIPLLTVPSPSPADAGPAESSTPAPPEP